MKNLFTFLLPIFLLLYIASSSQAQISGTKNIPGDYATITEAISVLTSQGVDGPVWLELQEAYTSANETFPITFGSIPGASSTNTITLRPAAGVTTDRLIATSSDGGSIIILNGCQYIIIDGRPGGSGTIRRLTIRNSSTSSTAGTNTILLQNGAQNNIVRWCNIENSATNTANASANVFFGTTSGLGNNDNIITDNIIRPVGTNQQRFSIVNVGNDAVPNSNNTISNNEIVNTVFWPITLIGGTGNNWSITGNHIYFTTGTIGTPYIPIYIFNANSNGHTISGNFIGGSAPNCGGTAWTVNWTAYRFLGIYVNVGTVSPTNIDGNTIANMNFTVGPTSSTLVFNGIGVVGGNVNVGVNSANIIGSQTANGNITIVYNTTTTAVTAFVYGIFNSGAGVVNIKNNLLGGFNFSGNQTSGSLLFRGIVNEASAPASLIIENNFIGGTVSNSIQSTATTRPVSLQGVTTFGNSTIRNNVIRNFRNITTSSPIGIFIISGTTGQSFTIRSNTISTFTQATSAAAIIGIQPYISTSNVTSTIAVDSNIISGFSSDVNQALYGIFSTNAGGLTNAFFNGSIDANLISNFSNTNTGSSVVVRGIQSGNAGTNLSISNNVIHTLTTASANTDSTSVTSCQGIGVPTGITNLILTKNQIYNISNTNTSNANIHVAGIGVFGSGAIVSNNRIYDLKNSSTGTTSSIRGIITRGTGDVVLSNNQISLGNGVTGNLIISGIENNSANTSLKLYYNSVFITGSVTSGANNTGAFFRNAVATPVELRNNLFFNNRSGGTGFHYAIRNTNTTPATGWPATASNYNLFVATAAARIGEWGSGTGRTFTEWQTSSGGDGNSWSEVSANVSSANLFVDPINGNLNIKAGNTEAWYVNGKGIALAGQANDYDSVGVRCMSVACGATDIGSDEFIATSTPPVAIASAPPAPNTTTTYSFAGRTIGSILWGSDGTLPSSISVRYYSGTDPNFPQGLYGNCYWDITATGGSGYSCNLTLNYDAALIKTISAQTNIILAKRDGGGWLPLYTTVVNVPSQTVTVSGITSFSEFALTDSENPLPIQIASLTANINPNGSGVLLEWTTISETNVYGFYVERKLESEEQFVEIPNSFIPGAGTTLEPQSYSFVDNTLKSAGTYHYRLRIVDNDGLESYSQPVVISVSALSVREVAPIEFRVYQNYPNPFNPTTTIKFSVEKSEYAQVIVYNALGQKVATLFDGIAEPGYYYKVNFDATSLSSGVYYYCVVTNSRSEVKKMFLLK